MRKWLIIVASLAVAASACGGDPAATATASKPAETSANVTAVDTTGAVDTAAPAPTSTEAEAPEAADTETSGPDTTVAGTEPPPDVEGPPAPDFALALADGSEFMLSAEQKPVYLVFWAEW